MPISAPEILPFPVSACSPTFLSTTCLCKSDPTRIRPAAYIENTAQLQENITKSWGVHTIKAGYAAVDIILTGYFVQRVRGDYDYATLQEFLTDHVAIGRALRNGVSAANAAWERRPCRLASWSMRSSSTTISGFAPNLTLEPGCTL